MFKEVVCSKKILSYFAIELESLRPLYVKKSVSLPPLFQNGMTIQFLAKPLYKNLPTILGITVEELLADEPAPSVRVNNGIIGNQNSHNVVSVGAVNELGEIEMEIVNICKKLDIKRKNALLTRAYELLDQD